MNFFRRVKKQLLSSEEKDDARLISLYNIVRTHGDEILSGRTKLSLTTPILILLNGTFQKHTEGVNQPCFQVANIGSETNNVEHVFFMFEFMQKVISLKLVSGPHSLNCPLLNIESFKSLQVLEIRKFPIVYLKNLNSVRRQLKSLTCFRSTNSFKDVVNSFGKDTEDLYPLPALTSLDLSYNTIEEIDDTSLRLLPSLEILNLSFNCIKQVDSVNLPSLNQLNLGFNAIAAIPVLPPKVSHSLTSLILRNNNLSTLKGLESLSNLELLDLAANCIVEFADLDPLAYLHKLLSLSLKDNPISFNLNYVHCTVRKLSPVKRYGKILLDGKELDEADLQYLGQDVQPISLVSYIPEKPMGVPKGNLLNLINSLPKLATSVPNESTPVQNGRIKQKAPVREAAILDFATSPVAKNLYDIDTISYTSSKSSRSSLSANLLDTSISSKMLNDVYTSKRGSETNSLVWVNQTTGEETKQNDVSAKPSIVDYASWPVENPDQSLNDLLSDSEDSRHDISDDLASNIYGNQSALSLPTLEQEINGTDEAVVISVVSSDDVNGDGDNDSLRSVTSILSECVDTDSTYLVQNIKRNKSEVIEEEQHLFLIFRIPYLMEKDTNGKLINKLDLSYLRDVKSGFDDMTLILTFDLMRIDWQHREYVFDQEEQLHSFMDNVQPIAVKNYQKKIAEMKHCECLKCTNVFLMNADCLENLYCTECGSTMVIDKNENHIAPTNDDEDCDEDAAAFGSTSTFKEERQTFLSVSSIEMEKLMNEPDATKVNDENNFMVSSWPPSGLLNNIKLPVQSSSLPLFGSLGNGTLAALEKRDAKENTSSTSRKMSKISKTSKLSNDTDCTNTSSPYNRTKTDYKIPLQKTHSNTPKNSVSSNSSKFSDRQLRSSSVSKSSLKSDTAVTGVQLYTKCDHRLKLFLSISIYQHDDEEFVCQLSCVCSQYNRIQDYDCLLNISNKAVYLFSVAEAESDFPEDCLTKEASCKLSDLKFIHFGYYDKSFSFEFSITGCYYKFLTCDSKKTSEFLNLLKDEFENMDCFDSELPVFSKEENKHYIKNIRKNVFGIPESLRDVGERIHAQISSSRKTILKSQKIRLRTHHQCFVARELIDWLTAHRDVQSRDEGLDLCVKLMDIGFIFPVLSKQDRFTDSDSLYKFSLPDTKLNGASENEDNASDEGEEEMNTTIKLYSLADVRVSESDSTFHKRSIIVTESHIFLFNECHQWPLPSLHPPPQLLRDHIKMIATHKLINVTGLEFFEDAPCYANLSFEEDLPTGETDWLIRAESVDELHEIIDLIRATWESLFLIELKVVSHLSIMPLLDCYVVLDK